MRSIASRLGHCICGTSSSKALTTCIADSTVYRYRHQVPPGNDLVPQQRGPLTSGGTGACSQVMCCSVVTADDDGRDGKGKVVQGTGQFAHLEEGTRAPFPSLRPGDQIERAHSSCTCSAQILSLVHWTAHPSCMPCTLSRFQCPLKQRAVNLKRYHSTSVVMEASWWPLELRVQSPVAIRRLRLSDGVNAAKAWQRTSVSPTLV